MVSSKLLDIFGNDQCAPECQIHHEEKVKLSVNRDEDESEVVLAFNPSRIQSILTSGKLCFSYAVIEERKRVLQPNSRSNYLPHSQSSPNCNR